MMRHLSEEQFVRRILGQSGRQDMEHLQECPECRAAIEHFQTTMAIFRDGVRKTAGARERRPVLTPAPPRVRIPAWSWGVAAMLLVFALAPLYRHWRQAPPPLIQQNAVVSDPDALMRAVDFEVTRTIPGPLEPAMALLPNDEPQSDSGGHP